MPIVLRGAPTSISLRLAVILEHISKIPKQDDCAAELEEGQEVGSPVLPAGHQPAELVKPGEQPLDLPAAAVSAQRAAILSLFPIAAVGRNQLDAVGQKAPV